MIHLFAYLLLVAVLLKSIKAAIPAHKLVPVMESLDFDGLINFIL